MNEIKRKVRAFIIDSFLFGDADDLTDDTSFLEEGVIDSTGILELITFIEDTFTISVDDEELIPENLDSITNVAAFLTAKLENSEAVVLAG